ncbi:repressor LexA [Candidatus Peregrinibacteria bacterium]|nr:repressor LexA [Candidatus Peregrinibacteria bacterium]
MNKLIPTPKEKSIFEFIEAYQLENGASPTVKEIRRHMKLKSDGFIVHCLKSLVKKGAIEKGDTPRSIRLLPAAAQKLHADVVKLPVLGSIPAGGPVISEGNIEGWVSFEADKIKKNSVCFALKVMGESMTDAGILEGDFVVADSVRKPRASDIVVALVDGGSTVKRYMLKDGKPYLKPENPKYGNIYPESELQIQGVVVGLIRWY